MSDDVVLLPCPFCGGTDLSVEREPETMQYVVFCAHCGPMCFNKYKLDTIHSWNTRTPKKCN